MKLPSLTLLLCYLLPLVVAVLANEDEAECELVPVHGKQHKTEVLFTGLDRPYHLSIYKHEHKIFFSYNIGTNTTDTFELGFIERGKTKVEKIPEVINGFASAVDEENHIVYLGGSTGVYKHHLNKTDHHDLEKIISKHNIWFMFYKEHHLYFIDYPSQRLYRYNTSNHSASPKRMTHIKEKIYHFVIDKDNDEFITTDSGVYSIKHGSRERTHYSNVTLLRGAALNKEGHAHFCGNHSIYVTNKHAHTLEEIARVQNIFGITFDKQDNIIYSDPFSIIKLLEGSC